ncbi:MAG: anti-sigma factor antagonist [Clostridiales bacterium]|nr:anti-sigma factor antagonist [Clostridiales bacterium]
MRFNTEQIGDTLVVKLYGEIDQHCTAEIRDEIDRAIDINNLSSLIFDLGGVTFMDSSGLGMIMGRYKKLKAMGGKMMLVRPRPQVDRVLELSGIKKLLDKNCG